MEFRYRGNYTNVSQQQDIPTRQSWEIWHPTERNNRPPISSCMYIHTSLHDVFREAMFPQQCLWNKGMWLLRHWRTATGPPEIRNQSHGSCESQKTQCSSHVKIYSILTHSLLFTNYVIALQCGSGTLTRDFNDIIQGSFLRILKIYWSWDIMQCQAAVFSCMGKSTPPIRWDLSTRLPLQLFIMGDLTPRCYYAKLSDTKRGLVLCRFDFGCTGLGIIIKRRQRCGSDTRCMKVLQ